MRCMQHFNDSTSYNGGVCSSCLKERLFLLIVAQNEFNLSRQQDRRRRLHDLEDDTDFENDDVVDFIADVYPIDPISNTPPPGYEDSRRQSDFGVIGTIDGGLGMEDPSFYTTPQVGPNGKLIIAGGSRCYGKWSLFRSKSEKQNPGVVSDPCPDPDVVDTGIYNSWFEKFFTGRRRTVSVKKPATAPRRNQVNSRISDRGVSPVRFTDEEDENWHRRSSGSSSESSMPWNKTPKMTPAWVAPGRKGIVIGVGGGGSSDSMCSNGKSSHKGRVTGFGFCWSPLVRARPNRHRKGITPDMIVSGDLPAFKPPLCNAVSLYKNRSRKLTDVGRFRHHR